MAIKVMSRVWDFSNQSGTDLLTALALADRADDDGVCWPGIKYLAEKTRSSDRQAQRNVAKLEERGELYVSYQRGKGGGRGNTNLYFVVTGLTQPEIEEILVRRFELSATTANRAAMDILDRQKQYKGKGDTNDTLSAKGDTDDIHIKGDTNDTLTAKKGDIQGKRVTSRAEKGDIAMSPDSSKNPSLDSYSTINKADYSKICKLYQAEIGGLSPLIADKIKEDISTYPAEWIELAVCRAAEMNKRSWGYVEGILRNWQQVGGPQNDRPKGVSNNGHTTGYSTNNGRGNESTASGRSEMAAKLARLAR